MRPSEPAAAHSHRPTQKQTNKAFKSGHHSSKSSLKDAAKGRTSRPSVKARSTTTNANLAASHAKVNRRNHAKQMQGKKLAALEDVGRIFSRKGADRVSRVVAVVPLTGDLSALEIVEELLKSVDVECEGAGAVRTGECVLLRSQWRHRLGADPSHPPAWSSSTTNHCGSSSSHRPRHLRPCSPSSTRAPPPISSSLASRAKSRWTRWARRASERSPAPESEPPVVFSVWFPCVSLPPSVPIAPHWADPAPTDAPDEPVALDGDAIFTALVPDPLFSDDRPPRLRRSPD